MAASLAQVDRLLKHYSTSMNTLVKQRTTYAEFLKKELELSPFPCGTVDVPGQLGQSDQRSDFFCALAYIKTGAHRARMIIPCRAP